MSRVKTAKPSRRARRAALADAPVFAAPPAPIPTSLSPDPAPTHRLFSRTSRRKKQGTSVVTDLDELITALEEQKVQITLGNDIIVSRSIVIDYDVAIDFNGHNLISEQTAHDFRVLDIRRGEVTLTGVGKIFALGLAGVAVRIFGAISASIPNYTTVTIDEQIELFTPEGSGILISANLGAAYGVTLNFSGNITARSGICLGQGVRGADGNLPVINVKSGAMITADDTYGAALEAAGLGIWKIGAAKLYGLGGLWLRLGSATLEHTHIFSKLSSITLDGFPGANLSLEINDGIYLSAGGYAVSGNSEAVAVFNVFDGVYAGASGVFADELMSSVQVSGGDFSTDIKAAWSEFAPSDFAFPTLPEPENLEESSSPETPTNTTSADEPSADSDTSSDILIIPSLITKKSDSKVSSSPKTKKSSTQSPQKTQKSSKTPKTTKTSKTSKTAKTSETTQLAQPDDLANPPKSTKTAKSNSKFLKNAQLSQASSDASTRQAPTIELSTQPIFSTVVPKFEVIASPIMSRDSQNIVNPVSKPVSSASNPVISSDVSTSTINSASVSTSTPITTAVTSAASLAAPAPAPIPASATSTHDTERDNLINNLLEAITAMRELRSSDYDYGYEELQSIVASAEVALRDPELSIAEISSFAAEILEAFDQLEEHDDFSLSDDELDQLFYQGAVLQEVATGSSSPVERDIAAELASVTIDDDPDDFSDVETDDDTDDDLEIDADLSILAASLGAPISYPAPLESEAPAGKTPTMIANSSAQPTATAPMIDPANSVSPDPDPAPSAPISRAPKVYHPKIRSVAPISPRAPLIDEFAPATQWTTGIVSIDELTPVTYNGPAIRYRRHRAKTISKFYRSLSAGVRAGVAAFNASRHGVRA